MTEADLAALHATVRLLKDRQDIYDCIVREARGRDRQDEALVTGCYWPDGTDEHGPVITPGPLYGARANAGHAMFFAATSHCIGAHSCELEGDRAWCETYVVGGLLSKDESRCLIAPGRYIDHMERRGGEWRILRRRTIVDMAAEGDAGWLKTKALDGFLRGSWSTDDPSYARPIEPRDSDRRW